MKRLLLAVAALLFAATVSHAQSLTRLCFTTDGNNCVAGVQAASSVAISLSSATTTELVAAVNGKRIYVTSFNIDAAATGTIQFVYSTVDNCASGTTALTGAYSLTATTNVLSVGSGLGGILFVPAGNNLCAVTTGSVSMAGSLSYSQF